MPEIPVLPFSSFNYFEALFNKTRENTIILIDKHGIVTAVNQSFADTFGYQPDDIVGRHASVLFTKEDQEKGLPEKEINSVLSTGQGSDNNYLVSKDGSITWVLGEAVLVKNENGEVCILKVIQNIHQQKVSEQSLQRLSEFNENILSAINEVIIVLDEYMSVFKANKAFSAIFSYNYRYKEPIKFSELVEPYDTFNELRVNIRNVIGSGRSFSNLPFEITIAGGEKRIYDVSGSSMHSTGDENHVLIVMHDITVHKQVEREREDVIGFVAHELRNPLANLVLCNDIMEAALAENDLEELNDMLQRSKSNVMRLNKMIADLYDTAKLNAGKMRLDRSFFNLNDMLEEAIDTVKGLQPLYNIIVSGEPNVNIYGDQYRLIQVVTNYLSNGIKYSNGNTDVSLTVTQGNKEVIVSVKDEGLGIPANQLPYIFERFYRAEKTKNLEGIGLGLYLCRQIIHAHNGNVWAESEEGKGSTFYFSIPL